MINLFKLRKRAICNESGRSMVEVLGVLAIMGLLSVVGVGGYTTAMHAHKANEAVEQALRLAMLVSSQRQLGNEAALSDADLNSGPYSFVLDEGAPDDKTFALVVTGLPEAVQKRIAAASSEIAEVSMENGEVVFTFNDDLSPISERNSGSDESDEEDENNCPKGYAGEECDECASGYMGDNCDECATGYEKVNGACLEICSEPYARNSKGKCYVCADGWHKDPNDTRRCAGVSCATRCIRDCSAESPEACDEDECEDLGSHFTYSEENGCRCANGYAGAGCNECDAMHTGPGCLDCADGYYWAASRFQPRCVCPAKCIANSECDTFIVTDEETDKRTCASACSEGLLYCEDWNSSLGVCWSKDCYECASGTPTCLQYVGNVCVSVRCQ